MRASITGKILYCRLAEPRPPDRHEQAGGAEEAAEAAVVLQRVDDLGDADDEDQVEEELEPGGVPLLVLGPHRAQPGGPPPPLPQGCRHPPVPSCSSRLPPPTRAPRPAFPAGASRVGGQRWGMEAPAALRDQDVAAHVASLGLPGIVDLHVHFMPSASRPRCGPTSTGSTRP